MKTLLLFRHAKSDWAEQFEHDHDRPLNKRGKRAAKLIGRHLAAIDAVPDRVISSSADRAAQTANLAAKAGGWKCEIQIEEALYQADPQRIVEILHQQSDQDNTLMLVGHEPTFSQTASVLIGGGHLEMKTAAIAFLEFDVERWSDIQFSSGTLSGLIYPKLIEESEIKDNSAAED